MRDEGESGRSLRGMTLSAIDWWGVLFAVVFVGWVLAKWRAWDNIAAGLMVVMGVLLLGMPWSLRGTWDGTSRAVRIALEATWYGSALMAINKGVTDILLRNQP